MAYQIAKSIGELAIADGSGCDSYSKGGIAYSEFITEYIKKVSFIAPVRITSRGE